MPSPARKIKRRAANPLENFMRDHFSLQRANREIRQFDEAIISSDNESRLEGMERLRAQKMLRTASILAALRSARTAPVARC
jgi:hypothetical protein